MGGKGWGREGVGDEGRDGGGKGWGMKEGVGEGSSEWREGVGEGMLA